MLEKIIWISHSAISDFETCPRLYYFRHIYRNPITGNKVQLVNPYLTLGTVVHKVLEEVNLLPPKERLGIPLLERFERLWSFCQGKKGGFVNENQEIKFKERGEQMLEKIEQNPRIIKNPSYRIKSELPKVRLFKNRELLLVGNIDWIEALPDEGAHIIDFKTGKNEEKKDSLQLPIYMVLAKYYLKHPVKKVSFWYLAKNAEPVPLKLEKIQHYIPKIREKALEIKRTVDLGQFFCSSLRRNCECKNYEKISMAKADYVGYDSKMNKDLFFIKKY